MLPSIVYIFCYIVTLLCITFDALQVHLTVTDGSVTILLQIHATLPVTTAIGEMSFSALRYLRNYLHLTMCEDRLNKPARLYINRDVDVDCCGVTEEFAWFNRHVSFV